MYESLQSERVAGSYLWFVRLVCGMEICNFRVCCNFGLKSNKNSNKKIWKFSMNCVFDWRRLGKVQMLIRRSSSQRNKSMLSFIHSLAPLFYYLRIFAPFDLPPSFVVPHRVHFAFTWLDFRLFRREVGKVSPLSMFQFSFFSFPFSSRVSFPSSFGPLTLFLSPLENLQRDRFEHYSRCETRKCFRT